jgi:hypothetical protein
MWVLDPCVHTLDGSARPPIETKWFVLAHMSAKSPSTISPNRPEGCYLTACTSHLYQTLVLPKHICTELICTTLWIYHGGPGTIEKRPNDSPVRASFPECVWPYLEDGKNEVCYRWARYRWALYRRVGKPEIGETKLCKLRGLANPNIFVT